MKILKNDNKVTALAKKAAMVCQYAIHNPLHVFFEDGNFHTGKLELERKWNEEFKDKNGQALYEFINIFCDEWDALNKEEKREAFRLFYKKWDYLSRKWRNKILTNSNPVPKGSGFCYTRYLGEDGHIYVKTDKNIHLMQF